MGQTANQIENQIENQRDSLGSNLHELEGKMKSMTDWRTQFSRHPLTFIGLAFGGGVLLATMTSSGSDRRHWRENSLPIDKDTAKTQAHRSPAMDKAREAVENIKGALVGVAIARVKEYADQVIPGFSKQFHEPSERKRSVV